MDNCPTCGHFADETGPRFSLISWLLRRAPQVGCLHYDVEQDALADLEVRCECSDSFHLEVGSKIGALS